MRNALAILILAFSMSIGANRLCAETINIVALGDSNTFGAGLGRTSGGVSSAEAYPAKLERALRARGWDVSVVNQGAAGRTTSDALYTLDQRIPPGTRITIIELGLNDRNFLGASPPEIASRLAEIIRRVRAKGSSIILVRYWPQNDAAFAAVEQSADAVVNWWSSDLYSNGHGPRPEYDPGDHSHLNAAGTDVVVSHALPDMERVLTQMGFRPNR
jgi:acyl-CoA thioesterase-1